MIKGMKNGIEEIERKLSTNKSDLLTIPNMISNKNNDKPYVRFLSDAIIFDIHNLFTKPATEEFTNMLITYGRAWDFCVEDLKYEGKCKHCRDYLESMTIDKKTAIKRPTKRFIYPVLMRPTYFYNSDNKKIDLETKIGYIDLSPTAAKGLEDQTDGLRKTYGDNPNNYLSAKDIRIWKNDKQTLFQIDIENTPLTDADKKLICEYFGIDEYTPEKVFDKMVEVWEEKEQEAITRLTVTTNTSIDTDDGEIPEFLGDNEGNTEL